MKTRDKRLTFSMDDIKSIAIAAASKGKTAKAYMEEAVISMTLMDLIKLKKK